MEHIRILLCALLVATGIFVLFNRADVITTFNHIKKVKKINLIAILIQIVIVIIPFFKEVQKYNTPYVSKLLFIASYCLVMLAFFSLLFWSVKNYKNTKRSPFYTFFVSGKCNFDAFVIQILLVCIIVLTWGTFFQPPLDFEFAITSHNVRNFIEKPQFNQAVLYNLKITNNTEHSADIYITTLSSPINYNLLEIRQPRQERLFALKKPCDTLFQSRGFVAAKASESVTLLKGSASIPNLVNYPADLSVSQFEPSKNDYESCKIEQTADPNKIMPMFVDFPDFTINDNYRFAPFMQPVTSTSIFPEKATFRGFPFYWKAEIRLVTEGKEVLYSVKGFMTHNPYLLTIEKKQYLTTGLFIDWLAFSPLYTLNGVELENTKKNYFRTFYTAIPEGLNKFFKKDEGAIGGNIETKVVCVYFSFLRPLLPDAKQYYYEQIKLLSKPKSEPYKLLLYKTPDNIN